MSNYDTAARRTSGRTVTVYNL